MQKIKLKQVRESKGYTQQDMADLLNTTTSSYCRKENGVTDMKRRDWESIAKVLKVPLEDIYEDNASLLSNIFYDYSSINNQNVGITGVMLEHLEDLISLLKEENTRLKSENERLKLEKK